VASVDVTEETPELSRFSPRRIPHEIRKATAMASSFAAAYTIALGRPFPRNLPVGVVGAAADTAPLVAALHSSPSEFDVHDYPTREAAITAVNQQRTTAVIAATILGFITMFQLRANVKTLTLGRWLGCLLVLAVIGGAALSFVTGPVLHALQTPFGELWLLTSLQIAVAASFNSTMLVLMHRWAIIPTWVVFILLGNTSSGGAVSASLLPQPFAFLNHALPSGATVSAIHAATYFPESQRPLPFIVLGLWLVACLTALLVSSRALGRSPAA
jgi:hypothetical protein